MAMTIDKLCGILKAHSEGKTIEYKCAFPTPERGVLGYRWAETDISKHSVSFLLTMELRIKPEPREIWLGVVGYGFYNGVFCSKLAAEAAGCSPVKFREVLDE